MLQTNDKDTNKIILFTNGLVLGILVLKKIDFKASDKMIAWQNATTMESMIICPGHMHNVLGISVVGTWLWKSVPGNKAHLLQNSTL